jgi:hypothetical protein
MTAFALRGLKRGETTCANGCTAKGVGRRAATKRAVFLDYLAEPYSVPLCKSCADQWQAAWDSALPAPEAEAAA